MSHEKQAKATGRSQGEAVPRWGAGLATRPPSRAAAARHPALSQVARRRTGIALFASLFLSLVAVLVWHLAHLPAKSPLIVAAATDYHWPLPPNGWAQEDIEGLKNHLGGQTLKVADASLTDFARHLKFVAKETSPGRPIIVYLSAHGVVDGGGRPCLLRPEDDPLDSNTWLPVRVLLEEFETVGGNHRFLLILDCNRQLDNWCIGLADNQFAERLKAVVTEADVPGLAVLNSASPGQRAWTSPSLGGSVFGHFLLRGLAGEADGDDGDRRISLHELASYLEREVDDWVVGHRAAHQIPFLLYPEESPDFAVAWSLRPKDLHKLNSRPGTDAFAHGEATLHRLWQLHQFLEESHPRHYAPLTWQRVEGQLLWLEQAALAGKAYQSVFDDACRNLKARLEHVRNQIEEPAVSPVRVAAILAEDETLLAKTLEAHSLAMAEYLGAAISPEMSSSNGSYSSDHLQKLLDRYQVGRLWQDTKPTEDVLDLHRLGERLAVPHAGAQQAKADWRAHLLVRPLLDDCDRRRRVVEDKVFLGSPTANGLAQQVRQVSSRYEEVRHINGLLAESYQIRDRAWRDLPYLAHWARGPKNTSGLLALFEKAHALDSRLRDREQTQVDLAMAEQSLQLAAEVNEALNGYRSDVFNEAGPLSTTRATPENLGRIATLLSTPLVPTELRTDLFSRFTTMLQEVDRNGQETDTAVPPGERQWAAVSFAAMLQTVSDELTPVDRGDLPAMGEKLRAALRETHLPALSNLTIDFDLPMHPEGPIGSGQAHTALHALDVERRLRRLVSLQSTGQEEPYQTLQRRHLQHLLLWHCGRALDDFWGSDTPGATSWFAVTADSYLKQVLLLDRADDAVRRKIVYLRELRDRRIAAAETGLVTTSTDLLLIDEDVDATAKVRVEVTPEGQSLPPGLATVCLRDRTTPVPTTIRPLPIGALGGNTVDEVSISVRGRELGDGKARQATVLYRGHEFPGPLNVQVVEGAKTEIVWHHDEASRITLRGPHFGQAGIVFILDCSHSMKEAIALEAPVLPGQNTQATKLHVAVAVLRRMLERIGERNDTRVGVRLFGHRVGWRTDQVDVVARQELYPRGIAPTLQPYEDVELLLPLGRFDSVTAGQVNHGLAALRPWGESPIYFALTEAVKDFDAENPQSERRIVVITDGINYQFNPPPEFAYRRNDVEKLVADRGIRVDIVGFAIPEDEQSEATREFRELAQKTNGSFTEAVNPSSLLRTLEQLVERTTYRVTDDTGQVYPAETGETVHVQTDGRHRVCRIEVVDLQADAVLEGGESLQLMVSRDRQIKSLPYEVGSPVLVPLIANVPREPSGYLAGFHRPVWSDGSVEFPVSFQRTDQGIPQRPRAVWIEVSPKGRDGTDSPDRYLFYDANYEPDLPVPLLRCRCLEWPDNADSANVRLWCLPEELAPDEIRSVDAVANCPPDTGTGFPLPEIPGVQFQVRTVLPTETGGCFQVRVIQRHDTGVPINDLKVEILPKPDRILRQFDWTRGIVLHTFDYAIQPPHPELRFQARSRFAANAWRHDQAVVLNVAKHNDVVVPPQIVAPQDRAVSRASRLVPRALPPLH